MLFSKLVIGAAVVVACSLLRAAPALQGYAKPGELAPVPEGKATLYRVPWRSNVRTVAALNALQGVGVYYKHIPGDWTEEDNIAIMKQMAAAGVKRMRLAPHLAIYITKEWTGPKPQELEQLRKEFRACKAAGIRPCVTFVHIPPVGKPGTRELQEWWRQGELLPAGEVGSPEFTAYQDKTYEALKIIVSEARAAGFTTPESYDLEMGQNLWWGAPAVPRPMPSTGLEALKPGGRIYEFDRGLIQRLRADGFVEPSVWWSETHHIFALHSDDDVPPECVGRASSFYSSWSGITTQGWLGSSMYDNKARGVGDVWPVRPPLTFLEKGAAPELVLAKPEGWMADYSRHDNLMTLMLRSKIPVAVVSLGTVPGEIPDWQAGGMNGWEIKSRALTRSLAFWLNQGAPFVLLHSAYEPGAAADGELAHSLIPAITNAATFRYQDAPPLVTLRAFCDGLDGAKPVETLRNLRFRYTLAPDPVLIPKTGTGKALRASDAVALLPFQLDAKSFAVAAYVVTPNITQRMRPARMILQLDCPVTDAGVALSHPSTQMTGKATILSRSKEATTLAFDIQDDVTWLRFSVE